MEPWLNSLGGPFIILPETNVIFWGGSTESKSYPDFNSDYEYVCTLDNYIDKISIGGHDAIVLGDEPLMTRWIPSQVGGFIVRWRYAPNLNHVENQIKNLEDLSYSSSKIHFRLSHSALIFFDASDSGPNFKNPTQRMDLESNSVEIDSTEFSPDPETALLIHRISIIE